MDFSSIIDNIVMNHQFTIKCPKCKHEIKVAFKDNGSYVKCQNCHSDIKVDAKIEK